MFDPVEYRKTERSKFSHKKYKQSKKGKLVQRKSNKKHYQNNKEKCKLTTRKYQQNSKEILHELKINGCAICGYNKCDRALDFHHVNPEDRKFPISKYSVPNKNFVAELNKCILLCANCHREIHQEELKNG